MNINGIKISLTPMETFLHKPMGSCKNPKQNQSNPSIAINF